MKGTFMTLWMLSFSAVAAESHQLTSLCGFDFRAVSPANLFHETSVVEQLGPGQLHGPSIHAYRLRGNTYLELSFIDNDEWLHEVRVSKYPSQHMPSGLGLNRECRSKEGLKVGDKIGKAYQLYGAGSLESDGVRSYEYPDSNIEARIYFKDDQITGIEVGSMSP